jgi:hypothetical protein
MMTGRTARSLNVMFSKKGDAAVLAKLGAARPETLVTKSWVSTSHVAAEHAVPRGQQDGAGLTSIVLLLASVKKRDILSHVAGHTAAPALR